MDGIGGEVQEKIKIMRAEIQKDLSVIMEQFEFIRKKWEGMEMNRKEKRVASSSAEPTLDYEVPAKFTRMGSKFEDREHMENQE